MAKVIDKEAWLAERRKGLGGSDIAKICGLSHWGSGIDVYLDKKGLGTPQKETLRMKLGTYLEPFVTDEFMAATGKRCIEYTGMIHGTGERACCLGNLDRIVVEETQDIDEMVARLSHGDLTCVESILECKTCARLDDWYDENGNFKVPEYYMTQIDFYMGLIPSCKRVYVACVCTGLDCKFDFICIERKDDTINGLMAYAVKWWKDNIEADDQKAVMTRLTSEATSKAAVVSIYPKSVELTQAKVGMESDLDLSVREAMATIIQQKKVIAEAEEKVEQAEAVVAGFIGDNEALVSDDGRMLYATFKSQKDTVKDVTDWEAVAKTLAAKMDSGEDALKAAVAENTEVGKVVRRGARPLKVLEEPKDLTAAPAKRGKKAA